MAVEFLDPLGRGGKPSDIRGGIYWLDLVVLVERAGVLGANLLYGRMAVGFLESP